MNVLFENIDVLTGEVASPVLRNGWVRVENGKISDVSAKPLARKEGERVINGRNRILMPGLINTHTHMPMSVLRGHGDDMALQTWLNDCIWPVEDKMNPACARIATGLAIAEMVSSGTTSCSDMYFFCDEIAQAVAESGMKANLSRSIVHFDDSPVLKTDRWTETLSLLNNWHHYDNDRIKADCSIHAIYTSTSASRRDIAEYARENGYGMQVHLSETEQEVNDSLRQYGVRPAIQLDREGVLTEKTVAAHCVWLDEEEQTLLARRGVSAIHCPVSNLKLASGISPVTAMMQNGVRVCLGTDGSASNNALDMLSDMKVAALLPKGTRREPAALPAAEVLAMATSQGAKAQGRDDCGVIAPGMDADLVMLDGTAPNLFPSHNPLSTAVYAAHGGNVCMTMVRGKILYENGQLLTLDYERLMFDYTHTVLPTMFA